MPNLLAEIRRLRVGQTQPPEKEEAPAPSFDADTLRKIIPKDQSLSTAQQDDVIDWLQNPTVISQLRSGAIGSALSLLISKFLKMSPRNQLLLSIAGFGIGKIIYDQKNNPKNFSRWNKQLHMYEIEH